MASVEWPREEITLLMGRIKSEAPQLHSMISKEEILSLIREEELVDLLRELIRRPSQNPPGREKIVAEYIYDTLKGWGFEPEYVYKPDPDRPSVATVYEGKEERPRLVLNGHTDVVPEGDPNLWSVPPYEGVVMEGRVYGRGACDMKGGLAAMMIAAKAIKESGVELRGSLILHFAMGEETGDPGTKILLEEGYTGDWGIVLEPTDLKVMTAEKGLAWYHFTFHGKPTHASVPEQGVNAIEKALKLMEALKRYDEELRAREHPLCGRALCSITMIKGGVKENIIPESCWLAIDRRMIPGEDPEEVDREIEAIVERLRGEDPDFRCDWRRVMLYEAAEIPVDHELAEVVRRHTAEVTGVYPEPAGTRGSTDQRNFINDAGIPAITWGPGWGKAHEVDEYVKIKQLVDCTKILILTILDLIT
jgi:succinyl-diaminopimelate desuccinylase